MFRKMTANAKLDYPPRFYKTVDELALEENKNIRHPNIDLFLKVDERVHASTEGSKIVEFFKGKSIFVTGGTGFLGKLLIEKLLRSCKEIDTIYVLIRSKKDKNPVTRLENTFADPVFSELEKVQPKFRHKVVAINGDIGLPELGICQSERKLLMEKVNIIFHCAATVRFDEKLRTAASFNVSGTKEILDLAHQCKNFFSLVHVSTAFSNCNRNEVYEEFYESPYTTEELYELIRSNTDQYIEDNKQKLLKGWPNTYSLTKAVAEYTIKKNANDLPVCIFRPSIITSTYKEPVKCWIDNLYGPIGAVIGGGTGVLKSFYVDKELVADMVPGDYVVNGLIAAAYQNQFNSKGDIPIYQLASGVENPINWGDFTDLTAHYGLYYPTIKSLWCYSNTLNKNYYIHMLYVIFLHFIPAIFMDGYLKVIGKKPRMVELYRKIYKLSSILEIFSLNQWKFHTENTKKLWKNLSEIDKKLFVFDLSSENFCWNDYISLLGPGLRIYIVKDDLSTVPEARKLYKRLCYYHQIFKAVCFLIFLRLCYPVLCLLVNIFMSV